MSVLDRFRLDGKVAVVTGASSGLGAAFAVGLAEAGADVVVAARRTDRLKETAEQVEALGRRCLVVTADVAVPEDCTRVIAEAVEALGAVAPIVLMSARGRRFSQADAQRFAQGTELTLLCGHYKDVDQRVADHLATEEVSLGDFVLSGGEPAALAIIDATVRLLAGAMSDHDSARGDSFYERELSAPSYTRPPEYRGHVVPDVLLSGDHKKIAEWREREGKRLSDERG